jgi:hypothetical protein
MGCFFVDSAQAGDLAKKGFEANAPKFQNSTERYTVGPPRSILRENFPARSQVRREGKGLFSRPVSRLSPLPIGDFSVY